MKNYLPFFLILTLVFFCACNPKSTKTTEGLNDVQTDNEETTAENHLSVEEQQRIPDGVSLATHRHIKADGKGFTKARIEPPNWWIGMNDPTVELLVYEELYSCVQ